MQEKILFTNPFSISKIYEFFKSNSTNLKKKQNKLLTLKKTISPLIVKQPPLITLNSKTKKERKN